MDFILISAIIIIPFSKMNLVSFVFLQDCFRTSRETKIHTIRHREYYSRQQVTFEEWSVTDRDMVKQRTNITGNILLVWLSVDLFSFSDLSSMCRYSQSTQKYVVVGALNKASVVGCSHSGKVSHSFAKLIHGNSWNLGFSYPSLHLNAMNSHYFQLKL